MSATGQMLSMGEEVSLEADAGKANVHIRGWRTGSYMLVESPATSWVLKPASFIIGRLLFRGTYYGFETSAIGILPEVKLLILGYPANIVETAYRKEKRYSTTIPIVMHRENDKSSAECQGMIVNISKAGCRFLCAKHFKVDDTLVCNGTLPNGGALKDINFKVAHIIEQNGKYQYGGGFVTLREAHRSALKDFFEINSFFSDSERMKQPTQADKTNLPVGGVCSIQAGKSRYRSIFRGFEHPKYLLVDMPIAGGKPVTFQHHELCVIRFQNSGVVYGFETQVIKQYSKPVSLWVLSYSGDMERVNLRKSERVQTFLPATLVSEGAENKGAIVDFSVSGCQFVLSGEGVEPEDKCFLRMDLPDGTKIASLPCEVKNVRERDSNKFAGLIFSDVEGTEAKKMSSFYSICKQWLK